MINKDQLIFCKNIKDVPAGKQFIFLWAHKDMMWSTTCVKSYHNDIIYEYDDNNDEFNKPLDILSNSGIEVIGFIVQNDISRAF